MVSVIFPAAGQGRRMRAGRNKVLLTLGGERFTLFHDVPAAIAAYRAADTALAEVDDASQSRTRPLRKCA